MSPYEYQWVDVHHMWIYGVAAVILLFMVARLWLSRI